MRRICALLAGLLIPVAPACDRPTPVAPEGSTLTITANPSKIQIFGNSSITILARKLDGTPVNGGTEITLSTNLGEIEELVTTNSSGVALATLTGDGRVGTATVQAFSGAAGEASIEVEIGGLAAFIELSAQPSLIPRDGGQTTLRAQAFDSDGAPLVGNFITFFSEIGLLDSGGESLQTNTSGQVTDTLTVTRADISNLVDAFFFVTATTSGEGGAPIEESIEINIGGTPASMFFQATPTTIPLSGGSTQLLVGVRDGAGDPLPGVLVNFLTDVGSLGSGGSALTTDSLGEVRDTLTATQEELTVFGGTSFTVRAQAAGIGGNVLEQTSTIRISTEAPNAVFTSDPVENDCFKYNFDPRDSTGTPPLECTWNFDGVVVPGSCSSTETYSFPTTGDVTRPVSLTVSGPGGPADVATANVAVPHDAGDNCPP